MKPEILPAEQPKPPSIFFTVTPLSKFLAMVLFVILPFAGGWIGYTYAPDKVVEVDRVVVKTVDVEKVTTEKSSEKFLSTTTVDMGSYRIRYSLDRIELLKGPEIVQTIPWDTSYRSFFTDDDSLLITNRDINYDHYLDLGVLSNVGSGGANRFYHFYIFDPTLYRLVLDEDFSTFEPDLSALVNPSFDIVKRTITSGMLSGEEWAYQEYVFREGRYIKGKWWSGNWE